MKEEQDRQLDRRCIDCGPPSSAHWTQTQEIQQPAASNGRLGVIANWSCRRRDRLFPPFAEGASG